MIGQVDKLYIKARPSRLYSRLISYLLFEGRPLTTRGRWFNKVVFFFFKIVDLLPFRGKVTKPIFILGTGRSGTTILGIVLSMHKDVGYLNEPKALWNYLVPNEDLIGNYTKEEALYRLSSKDASQEVKEKGRRFYSFYESLTFNKRTVDKYPEMIFRVDFIKALFPDAKFLFLSRNGNDTCLSIEGWSKRLGNTDGDDAHDWWGVNKKKWLYLVEQIVPEHPDLAPYKEEMRDWNDHPSMAAVEWIVSMREGLRHINDNTENFYQVVYEDLCSDVDNQLANMASFLELGQDQVFSSYAKKTLQLPPTKPTAVLNPKIIKPFNQTMSQLGYKSI